MTPRKRVPYFNVPASQQPLRIRARDVRGTPRPPEQDNPLEQLVVGHLVHPLDDSMSLRDVDAVEALDAAHEDANGRLPHEAGYVDPWEAIAEVMPVDPADTIPDWVLADAREMAATGMTLRRIAKAVLPATGCPDVPSCAELLEQRLMERNGPA